MLFQLLIPQSLPVHTFPDPEYEREVNPTGLSGVEMVSDDEVVKIEALRGEVGE